MEEQSRSFEMSISRQEFLRLLLRVFGGASFEVSGNLFLHAEAGRHWRIVLEPLAELELGALRFERHGIHWYFSGYSESEIEAVIQCFDLHFHRGGG